jgi:hypothetical protein
MLQQHVAAMTGQKQQQWGQQECGNSKRAVCWVVCAVKAQEQQQWWDARILAFFESMTANSSITSKRLGCSELFLAQHSALFLAYDCTEGKHNA